MDIITHKNIFLRISKSDKPKGDVWFIHGYGESGLSFSEAFVSPLVQNFNLFVPDLPGFGVSPLPNTEPNQLSAAAAVLELIQDLSAKNPIHLVAHSQGGLIGNQLCHRLHDQVKSYANVEGNLTHADITFSGIAAKKDSARECKDHVLSFIRDNAQNEESYWRYYASLRFATKEALFAWAKNGIIMTGDKMAGDEYAAIQIPKLYLWGKKSCSQITRDFLKRNNLESYCFENSDHWPMIDEPEKFYKKLGEFFLNANTAA